MINVLTVFIGPPTQRTGIILFHCFVNASVIL